MIFKTTIGEATERGEEELEAKRISMTDISQETGEQFNVMEGIRVQIIKNPRLIKILDNVANLQRENIGG